MTARPLFVVGAARSGTTLVRAVLGAHHAIELVNESELLPGLVRAGLGPAGSLPAKRRLRLLLELGRDGSTRRHIAALAPDRVAGFLTAPAEIGLREAYELLLPRPEGDVLWGEKSLGNAYVMSEIAAAFPDACFVHVLRDPRGATASQIERNFLGPSGAELGFDQDAIGFVAFAAMRWASWTDAIDGAAGALAQPQVVRLCFEELVERPDEVIAQTCAQVGVDFDPGMLDPGRRRSDPVLSSTGSGHERLVEPIDPTRAVAGADLPPWATHVVRRYAHAGAERHGYVIEPVDLPASEATRLEQELRFLEPILDERLNRDPSRAGRPIRRRDDGGDGSADSVEALRALAATAMERREDAQAITARWRRKTEAAEEKLEAERARSDELRKRLKEVSRRAR